MKCKLISRNISKVLIFPGSTAEDAYFAIKAMDQGYTFDFIEGEMWEKSPFTFNDFIKQRKRWMQGIFLVATDPKLSFKSRFFIGLSILAWITVPLSTSNVLLAKIFPPEGNKWEYAKGRRCDEKFGQGCPPPHPHPQIDPI